MDRTRPSCEKKGGHPGWGSFFLGKHREGLVDSSLPCDATTDEWDRRIAEYASGTNPLILCEDAAVEKGLKW
jgi:hypothetical protein